MDDSGVRTNGHGARELSDALARWGGQPNDDHAIRTSRGIGSSATEAILLLREIIADPKSLESTRDFARETLMELAK